MRQVFLNADDFGLSESVNEGIEQAYRCGMLQGASLMVAGPAVADAVRRAHTMPALRVGLHLVVIEGVPILPTVQIPGLVDNQGRFPSDQLRLGLRYFFNSGVRRQLAAEIRGQFMAFAATGLQLHHADSHKHMHLHPVVGRMMIEIGREFGLHRVRIPAEPPSVLAACGDTVGVGAQMLYRWTRLLRRQVRNAGMTANDHLFGLAWTGHMTAERLLRLTAHLPEGSSEIYFHPASRQDPILTALMPEYEHEAELAALLDRRVRAALEAIGKSSATPG